MLYQGGKSWAVKSLLPIILKGREPGQMYVEPFVGGCNMIDSVPDPRIGGDTNTYLIELVKALQDGWDPPREVPEELYNRVRTYFYAKRDGKHIVEEFDDALVGYIGLNLSVKARMFGGYKRDPNGGRNYAREAYNNVIRQAPKLKGIEFFNTSYDKLPIPDSSIIYCDPPYENTVGYRQYSTGFDHTKFWNWCRTMSNSGHSVFVSEYNAPSDFQEIWSQRRGRAIEKLFVYKPIKESRIMNWSRFISI